MSRIIQPDEFRTSFLTQVERFRPELLARWNTSGDYTGFMLDGVSGPLWSVANSLGFQYYREYWSIDAVLYAESDKENLPYGTYARCLAAAIEHENVWSSAHEELNKLAMIDTPLKVLITYPQTEAQRQAMLDRFAGMLAAADTFQDFADRRRHLIVSGFRDGDQLAWRFDCYDGTRFRELGAAT